MVVHITPWIFDSSNPRSLAVNQSRARRGRPCSGDGGHRRRGLRAGKDSGAYGGPVALLVEDWDGREREISTRTRGGGGGVTVDGEVPVVNVGKGPAHENQYVMGKVYVQSIG
jgi:hypothetical protein